MSILGKIKTLKDKAGNYIFPQTTSDAVICSDGKNIDTKFSEVTSQLDKTNNLLNDFGVNIKTIEKEITISSDIGAIINNAFLLYNTIYVPDGDYTLSTTVSMNKEKKLILSNKAKLIILTDIDGIILKDKAIIQGGIIEVVKEDYSKNTITFKCEQNEGIFAGSYQLSSLNSLTLTNTSNTKSGVGLYLEATGNDTSSFIVYSMFENLLIDRFEIGIKMISGDGTALPGTNPHPYINSNCFNNIILNDNKKAIYMDTNNGEIAANQWSNLTIQGSPNTELLMHFGTSCFNNQFTNVYIWDIAEVNGRKLLQFKEWGNQNYIMNNLFSNQYGELSEGIDDKSYGNIIDRCYSRSFDNIKFKNLKSIDNLTLNCNSEPNKKKGLFTDYSVERDEGISIISAWGSGRNGIQFHVYNDYSETPLKAVEVSKDGLLRPLVDNVYSCGSGDRRWTQIFSTNGVINTSDKNLKSNIEDIPQNICDASLELKIVRFKFKEAIDKKGNNARFHYGVIAQDAMEVFEKHGVNIDEFGVICIDEFYDKDGNAITKNIDGVELNGIWQVRYNELQMIITEAIRRKIINN